MLCRSVIDVNIYKYILLYRSVIDINIYKYILLYRSVVDVNIYKYICCTGVLLTAVCLITEMCEKSPDTLTHFRKVCTLDKNVSCSALAMNTFLVRLENKSFFVFKYE